MKQSSHFTILLIFERYSQLLSSELDHYYPGCTPTLLLGYQTLTKAMADKKESPETEHFESNIKSDPSTLIPPPGSARQPYGEPGITPSHGLYTHHILIHHHKK